MFIKSIALSHLQNTATYAFPQWGTFQRLLLKGDIDAAIEQGDRTIRLMRVKGRIHAASMLGEQIISGLKANKSISPDTLKPAICAVQDELGRLSNGKVRATLHMSAISSELAKKLGQKPIGAYHFFLPAEPLAVHRESAGSGSALPFEQAIGKYHELLAFALSELEKTRNFAKLKDIAEVAAVIHRRVPPSQAAIITIGISAWASGMHALLKSPTEAQLETIINVIKVFELWVRKGIGSTNMPPDSALLSYSLCVLTQCKTHRAAAHVIAQYGLEELFSKNEPQEITVPKKTLEAGFAAISEAASGLRNDSSFLGLSKVHSSIDLILQKLATSKPLFNLTQSVNELLLSIGSKKATASEEEIGKFTAIVANASKIALLSIDSAAEGASAAERFSKEIKTAGLDAKYIPGINKIPAENILNELAIDIRKAAGRLDFGDHDGAVKILQTTAAASGALSENFKEIEVFQECVRLVMPFKKNDWSGALNAYETLARSLDLFLQEPKAYASLLQELASSIATHKERVRAELESKETPIDIRGDREIFEIFMMEAEEVHEKIVSTIKAVNAAKAFDKTNSPEIRRAFHTLKGSARMAGLANVGEAAWLVEQHLNGQMATTGILSIDGAPMMEQVSHLILEAVRKINTKGSSPVNIKIVHKLLADLPRN